MSAWRSTAVILVVIRIFILAMLYLLFFVSTARAEGPAVDVPAPDDLSNLVERLRKGVPGLIIERCRWDRESPDDLDHLLAGTSGASRSRTVPSRITAPPPQSRHQVDLRRFLFKNLHIRKESILKFLRILE